MGILCNHFWQGKPSLPSGTLGSCAAGNRSHVALTDILQQLTPRDWPRASLPPPDSPLLRLLAGALIYYLESCMHRASFGGCYPCTPPFQSLPPHCPPFLYGLTLPFTVSNPLPLGGATRLVLSALGFIALGFFPVVSPFPVCFCGCILLLIPYRLGLFILVPHPSLTYALTLPCSVFMVYSVSCLIPGE